MAQDAKAKKVVVDALEACRRTAVALSTALQRQGLSDASEDVEDRANDLDRLLARLRDRMDEPWGDGLTSAAAEALHKQEGLDQAAARVDSEDDPQRAAVESLRHLDRAIEIGHLLAFGGPDADTPPPSRSK